MGSQSIRNHNILIEQGSATTSTDPSEANVQVSLSAPFAQNAMPTVVLTPIGSLASAKVFIEALSYNASSDRWDLTMGSTVPSITVQYRVIGYSLNNEKISTNRRSGAATGDGVGGSY
jgi:hypothetical protein